MTVGRSVFDYFSSRVWDGEHAELVLGWRPDQLDSVVELLAPYLSGDLTPILTGEPTPEMRYAIAELARTLVVDTQPTGQPLRYSRRKDHYRGPKRYRQGGRYYTFHYVTKAVDLLVQVGLAGHEVGEWLGSGGGGKQSVVWPTKELLELLGPVIDVGELRGEPHRAEVIVLRDRDDKKDIDYIDTDDTVGMRAEVEALNAALKQLRLHPPGKQFPVLLLRRIFNGDFTRGGRCYCQGDSFQNIRAEDRLRILVEIDGVLHRMVEIDYANLHAVMAYTEAGLTIPPGDQYEIDGINRTVIKQAFNTLLNAASREEAVKALTHHLAVEDRDLWNLTGLPNRQRSVCKPFAREVISAIEQKHSPIAAIFGSDYGARFQRRDSDMAVRVMIRMIERTGRCPLPVHDSFLVPDVDSESLDLTMREVALEEGLNLCLKVSKAHRGRALAPAPPSLSGGNNP